MGRKRSRSGAWFARAMRLLVMAALVAVMVPVGAPAASAAGVTYWVDDTGSDSNDGLTSGTAFKTITHAVNDVAGPDDTIRVMPGTYSTASGETLPIVLSGETLWSATGVAADTIIQGNGAQQLLVANGWVDGDMLKGFTFTNGGIAGGGAAVQINPSGTHTSSNEPLITANTFSGNNGALHVGGTAGAKLRIHLNIFQNNTATTGGAIRVDSRSAVSITWNTFDGNHAETGAAVHMITYDERGVVDYNTFTGNHATANVGGAMRWDGVNGAPIHSASHNTFSGNVATSGAGGAMYLANMHVTIASNTASGNNSTVGTSGFGYLEHVHATAENNYLINHSCVNNGSVWTVDPTSTLEERNDTVVGQLDGQQALHAAPGSTVTVTNCIYWNPALPIEMIGVGNVSYSCSRDSAGVLDTNNGTVGAGMVYATPTWDAVLDAPVLAPGSSCIDAGNPANYAPVDGSGTARPLDGDGNGSALPDIGCYEAAAVAPPVVLVPVYRFFNLQSGTHVYTASETERAHIKATWPTTMRDEGLAYYYDEVSDTATLHRLFNLQTGTHFYTASDAELNHVLTTWPTIFRYEGPAYPVSRVQSGTKTTVHRFFNLQTNTHFYTGSASEADYVRRTWPTIMRDEGPAFYVGQ